MSIIMNWLMKCICQPCEALAMSGGWAGQAHKSTGCSLGTCCLGGCLRGLWQQTENVISHMQLAVAAAIVNLWWTAAIISTRQHLQTTDE